MNRYKKSRLAVVVSTLILLSCSLLFLSLKQDLFSGSFGKSLRSGLSSVEAFLSQPVQLISKQREGLSELLAAYEENKQLKQTLHSLEAQLQENTSLKDENSSLRQSLQIQEAYADKQLIPALVTVRLPISWSNQIVVDAGTAKGVQKDMLVLANGGLLGVVSEAEENTATVKLLTNADEFTKIPVKISVGTQSIYGILSGYDTDQQAYVVSQLNSLDEIPVGSNVTTSDLGGTTPSNIQIGTVLSVSQKSGSFDREMFVKPSTSFETIYSVLVVGE